MGIQAARAEAVAHAIDEQLWDEEAGAYRLSRELPEVYPQDGNAAAVLAGVAGPERARGALAQLRARNWSRLGSLTVDPDASNAALAPFYAPVPSWFEVDARLRSSDPRGLGEQTLSRTFPINCDRWNPLAIDVTGWPERRSVTSIEIGFRALGGDQIWLPHFQIDEVGYSG